MRTHNIPSCYRKSKRSLLFHLTWLELLLSRTNFHGPKGVRAIIVRLFIMRKAVQKTNTLCIVALLLSDVNFGD